VPLDDVLTLHAEVLQLRADNESLKALAEKDDLTSLLNRRGLRTWSERYYDPSRTYGIIAIDIANFGLFNNNYGQDEGDKALALLGEVLPNAIRTEEQEHHERRAVSTTDVAAVRLGGDEFIVVVDLDHSPEDQLAIVMAMIEQRIADNYDTAGEDKLPTTPRLRMDHVFNVKGEQFESFFNRANASIHVIKAQQKVDEARRRMEELFAHGGGSFI
jgi:diguanylate cyclase (GGDEF)-like protein